MFLHYCQRYRVGPKDKEFVFWKRDLDEAFFACGGDALPLPSKHKVQAFLDEEGLSEKGECGASGLV